MTVFQSPVNSNLLLPEKTFANISREYGKSTPELRRAVRSSTTIFIHYLIDYATQLRQGSDENRSVMIKPQDIRRAIEELGFDNIIRKLNTKAAQQKSK